MHSTTWWLVALGMLVAAPVVAAARTVDGGSAGGGSVEAAPSRCIYADGGRVPNCCEKDADCDRGLGDACAVDVCDTRGGVCVHRDRRNCTLERCSAIAALVACRSECSGSAACRRCRADEEIARRWASPALPPTDECLACESTFTAHVCRSCVTEFLRACVADGPCHADTCVDGRCEHVDSIFADDAADACDTKRACRVDADGVPVRAALANATCDDGDDATEDTCIGGVCHHVRRPRCYGCQCPPCDDGASPGCSVRRLSTLTAFQETGAREISATTRRVAASTSRSTATRATTGASPACAWRRTTTPRGDTRPAGTTTTSASWSGARTATTLVSLSVFDATDQLARSVHARLVRRRRVHPPPRVVPAAGRHGLLVARVRPGIWAVRRAPPAAPRRLERVHRGRLQRGARGCVPRCEDVPGRRDQAVPRPAVHGQRRRLRLRAARLRRPQPVQRRHLSPRHRRVHAHQDRLRLRRRSARHRPVRAVRLLRDGRRLLDSSGRLRRQVHRRSFAAHVADHHHRRPCTTDSCDRQTGQCVWTPRDCGCNASDACTECGCSDDAGGCRRRRRSCDDRDATTDDWCDPTEGCKHRRRQCAPAPSPCVEMVTDPATGECLERPVDCRDANRCTEDLCVPELGGCVHRAKDCAGIHGNVTGASPMDAACFTYDCDRETGECLPPVPKDCDDWNPCSEDRCVLGVCTHAALPPPVVLGAPDDRCARMECHADRGGWVAVRTDCSDRNACTDDACVPSTGECVHTPRVHCPAAPPCHVSTCDPALGECVVRPVPVDDLDPCTVDACVVRGNSSWDVVHAPVCGPPPPPTSCVLHRTCDRGVCSDVLRTCQDFNPCTDDACVEGIGCVHTPTDCSDGLRCTLDWCSADQGGCRHAPVDCTSDDRCAAGSCDEETGRCVWRRNVCSDLDRCTDDTCDSRTGECVFTPIDCRDGCAFAFVVMWFWFSHLLTETRAPRTRATPTPASACTQSDSRVSPETSACRAGAIRRRPAARFPGSSAWTRTRAPTTCAGTGLASTRRSTASLRTCATWRTATRTTAPATSPRSTATTAARTRWTRATWTRASACTRASSAASTRRIAASRGTWMPTPDPACLRGKTAATLTSAPATPACPTPANASTNQRCATTATSAPTTRATRGPASASLCQRAARTGTTARTTGASPTRASACTTRSPRLCRWNSGHTSTATGTTSEPTYGRRARRTHAIPGTGCGTRPRGAATTGALRPTLVCVS
jgi:hypothetical protein